MIIKCVAYYTLQSSYKPPFIDITTSGFDTPFDMGFDLLCFTDDLLVERDDNDDSEGAWTGWMTGLS